MTIRQRPQRSNPRSIPVQVRLSPDKHARYENAAKLEGEGVATYLRRRLESEDQFLEVLDGMLEAIREIEQRLESLEDKVENSPGSPGKADAVAIETLLLLRSLATGAGQRQNLEMVRGELRRQGISPWELGEESR